MQYLLDTNICIYLIKQKPEKAGETHLINKDYLISIMTQKFALTSTY
ncbi:type II toxin-antitoxin system VapC family toxin [Dolichospermum sp. UHCC 0406]|nr:type II toxin-antitoxin system VapC family toxin [Dolichospermum sp. UHCC 0299]MTJ37416.1 type II toxin-antitoxin system VapC family toxin [Dolichospermum sp. UHCC 0406]